MAAVLKGRKPGYSAQNEASFGLSRKGCSRRSLELLCPLAMDILFPPLAGSSFQGGKIPEQVPGVLLLARGSLDGATDLDIHALNIPNMRKDGLSPGPELPALPRANQPL